MRPRRMRNGSLFVLSVMIVTLVFPTMPLHAAEKDVRLDDLIEEGLKNSPEIQAARLKADAAGYRIPQAKSLPDPMLMVGYQNDGFNRFTLGQELMSMGISNLSQQFYFPGKRGIKGEMAARDAESLKALSDAARHRVTAQIKLAFYDLLLAYKTLDILKQRTDLFSQIEDAAQSRYASGTGMQQEVVMAQTEKYMILEREEMQRQRVQALQGMLNTVVGRRVTAPLGRPVLPPATPFLVTLDQLVSMARDHSPDVRSRQKMVEGAEAKVKLARKEYFPDFTVAAGYFYRTGPFPDMWSVTISAPLPVFFRTKQRQALAEAQASLSEARRELTATELMLESSVKESFSMVQAADRLTKLYKEGLIPKTNQDVQLAFSNYVAGRIDTLTAITRIKNLLDYDLLYWNQLMEREKAVARLHAITGTEELPQVSESSAKTAAQGEAR